MTAVKLTCPDCEQGNRLPIEKLGANPRCGTCGAPLMWDKPKEVSLAWLQKAQARDEVPLVVDFWAAWCGPCRMMAPEFAKAASALKGRARFVKLDTEAHPQAGSRYGIRGIPLLATFKGGRETARQAGAMPAAGIVDWLKGSGVA
ncbi:thioredoxin family protein [Seohaeicola nanhaiensis]|uniref:Thioredoxin family protein n=1 Tax=Seohaeicola nanhaiensis TaxID=1387282 RepID=A0ABV9KBC3_9RHOB